MLAQLIQDYLVKQASLDPARFADPDLMVADLGLDSLSLVEMLFEVEDRYGLQIEDPMSFQTMKFSEMVAAIEAQVRSHHNGDLPHIDWSEAPSSPSP